MPVRRLKQGFTLIELLVVIAILGMLVAILLPTLSNARSQAKSTICRTRLRTIGNGMVLYANESDGMLVPGRLPKVDDEHWQADIVGGLKYRPTFLALIGSAVGLEPFERPLAKKNLLDLERQPGDRQNYSNEAFLCPEVPDWVDERNGCFGYNYQFLGNARLRFPDKINSFKNWPVRLSSIRSTSSCVAVADCTGTAVSFPKGERQFYEDNDYYVSDSGRTVEAWGNEGFNLDPPRVDPVNGEMACKDDQARTALHERHRGKGTVLWMDVHVSSETLKSLRYQVDEDTQIVGFEGDNRLFHVRQKDEPWLSPDAP